MTLVPFSVRLRGDRHIRAISSSTPCFGGTEPGLSVRVWETCVPFCVCVCGGVGGGGGVRMCVCVCECEDEG